MQLQFSWLILKDLSHKLWLDRARDIQLENRLSATDRSIINAGNIFYVTRWLDLHIFSRKIGSVLLIY
jgi:hypothetical protein